MTLRQTSFANAAAMNPSQILGQSALYPSERVFARTGKDDEGGVPELGAVGGFTR